MEKESEAGSRCGLIGNSQLGSVVSVVAGWLVGLHVL
jgi:hypothetical protein